MGERPHEVWSVPPPVSIRLRPCLGKGASQGKESVLADSGREGEITARVGRVRYLAFLSILRECLPHVFEPKRYRPFVNRQPLLTPRQRELSVHSYRAIGARCE